MRMETRKISSYFDLADRHFGGGLAKWLRDMKNEGRTYEWITHELISEHDIPLSLATVVRWFKYYV
jgi:hypothetical protein